MAANSSGMSPFAPHPTIAGLYVGLTDSTATGGIDPINFCMFKGVSPDTTANTYHHGCIAQVTSEASGTLSVYVNTGTYAAPAWTDIGALPPGEISLPSGQTLTGNGSGVAAATKSYDAVAVVTNGATAVPLFAAGTLPTPGSLTGVMFTAADDLNGTITVTNNGTTIATIVKGSQGSVKGSSIAASAFIAGGSLNVVSTSGNGTLTATFITG